MSEQPERNDAAFIDAASGIVMAAQKSDDPKIVALARTMCEEFDWQMIATLLLRYEGLKQREDELTAEINRLESVHDTQNEFLQRRVGSPSGKTLSA